VVHNHVGGTFYFVIDSYGSWTFTVTGAGRGWGIGPANYCSEGQDPMLARITRGGRWFESTADHLVADLKSATDRGGIVETRRVVAQTLGITPEPV
jgi:hypothetical protein